QQRVTTLTGWIGNGLTNPFQSSQLATIQCTISGIGLLMTPTWGSTGRLSPGPNNLAFDPTYLMQDGSLDPANCSSGWRVRSAIMPIRKTNFPIFLGSFSMLKISCG